MAILIGVTDYGWYFSNQIVLDRAVRDGARLGASQVEAAQAVSTSLSTSESSWTNYGLPTQADFEASTIQASGVQLLKVTGTIDYSAPSGLTPVPPMVISTITFRLEDQGS